MNLMELISDKDSEEATDKPLSFGSDQSGPPISLAEFLWLDGEIVPSEKVDFHIPHSPSPKSAVVGNQGIRCYATINGPALFRPDDHLQRFLDTVRLLDVEEFPYDLDSLRDAICRVVYVNNLLECYIRPLVFFDGFSGAKQGKHEPAVAIAAWKWDKHLDSATLEPDSSPSFAAISQMHSFAGIAGADFYEPYVNSIVALTLADRAGVDAAVTCNHEGFVNGCSAEILMLVKDKMIHIPPNLAMVESNTRNTILTLVRDSGYEIIEEPIFCKQLYGADEVFICSIFSEVMGVLEIDYLPIGDGHIGPVTHDLQQRYRAVVSGEDKRYQGWLDYMVLEPLI